MAEGLAVPLMPGNAGGGKGSSREQVIDDESRNAGYGLRCCGPRYKRKPRQNLPIASTCCGTRTAAKMFSMKLTDPATQMQTRLE